MDTTPIYSLRTNFSIIALTGKTGSGCTKFAEIISNPIDYGNHDMFRRPVDIPYLDELYDKNTVFKRKYNICYSHLKKNETSYTLISYIDVLMFYVVHYCIHVKGSDTLDKVIDDLHTLVTINFKKSLEDEDAKYIETEIPKEKIRATFIDCESIIEEFKSLDNDLGKINTAGKLSELFSCYYSGCFKKWIHKFYFLLGTTDYYLGTYFVHRIGNKIRAKGDPFIENKFTEPDTTENIYKIAILINKLIKAVKNQNNDKCHVVIDSLRNSLEIMFFKERYSAFYIIAVHNKERHFDRLKERIKNRMSGSEGVTNRRIEEIVNKVILFDKDEGGTNDFNKGIFYAPDVENCIQKSEIHISNPGRNFCTEHNRERDTSFYTMMEQWMRISALISHPGIVTPTHEERCMQIAYNSKFNSGCISRQVGAVITDRNHSIRSVGWNDVPKGSIPCNIRTICDIINPSNIDPQDKSYSDFEIGTEKTTYKGGGNFSENTKEIFKDHAQESEALGLNHSFCFKTLHNYYDEKENQVHTRSLHAEENAMLQISKFGGQPLMNGTLYTTASPCELCSKKAYQLGIRKVVYIDPYPGISMSHVLKNGYNAPESKLFTGIIGKAYHKLFEPFLSYKDELSLITNKPELNDKTETKKFIAYVERNYNIKLTEDISVEEIKTKLKELIKSENTETGES